MDGVNIYIFEGFFKFCVEFLFVVKVQLLNANVA